MLYLSHHAKVTQIQEPVPGDADVCTSSMSDIRYLALIYPLRMYADVYFRAKPQKQGPPSPFAYSLQI